MFVIRRIKDDVILGMSYTEEGLKFTFNNMTGKSVYFKNARIVNDNNKVQIKGDLDLNPNIYISKYEYLKPKSTGNKFIDASRQKIEDIWYTTFLLKTNKYLVDPEEEKIINQWLKGNEKIKKINL